MSGHDETPPIRVIMHQPGLAKYRVPVFRELAARPGIDLTVIRGVDPAVPAVPADGFRCIESAVHLRSGFHRDPLMRQSATGGQADVLVLPWNAWNLSLIPAISAARRRGVGTVLWGHGYSKSEQFLRRSLREVVGRRADAVVLYNHTAADALRARGFDDRRVFVARNSLDSAPALAQAARWRSDPDGLAAFRREQGLGDGPLLLFVSRLEPDNRTDLLLEAAARLRAKHPSLRVAIVGKGPETEALRALGNRLGLGDALVMPGPIYEEDAIAPWFAAASALVYPHNIGLTILHAFAYGCPVITSARTETQNPEIESLRPGENGLTFAHGDADDLARAIARLLEEPGLRDRLSGDATRTVTPENPDGFTVERMVDGLESVIRFAAKR